ncbi:MAG: hypothetical protein WBA76_16305 [Phormidesmis sp.]
MTYTLNPYAALGLKRNPFILESDAAISPPLWIDRGWSAPPPLGAKQLVQIIGVKGAGKTSHLKHWQAKTGGPYCYYPPGWKRLKPPLTSPLTTLAHQKIAYWDEADRMPLPFLLIALLIAAQTSYTVVAGTHTDLSPAAHQIGLSVTTINIPSFDALLLTQCVNQRIAVVRLPGKGCGLRLSRAKAEEIAIAANGSWREASDLLHIWAAELATSTAASSR